MANPAESPKPKKAGRKAAITLAAGLAAAGAVEVEQQRVNVENSQYDHAFTIEDMPLQEKIENLIGTTPYGNKYASWLSKKVPDLESFLRFSSHAGLLHMYAGELQSVEEAKQKIIDIRHESGRPVFISVDLEGGLVNHFTLTNDDLVRFSFPHELLTLRAEELGGNVADAEGKSPLPSQEWLGRKYALLKTEAEQEHFKKIMQEYGAAVARLCEYVGINLIFGPDLDVVANVDGDSPDAKNRRSFGSNPEIVSALGISYMRGFSQANSVVPVPKHFVGNGLSTKDPHSEDAEVSIGQKSGALLPFRDAINASSDFSKTRIADLEEQIAKLKEKNKTYAEEIANGSLGTQAKSRREKTISANERLMQKSEQEISLLRRGTSGSFDMGIMRATTSSNYYEPGIPNVYSRKSGSLIAGPKDEGGFGHTGLQITDDLSMASAMHYIEKLQSTQSDLDPEALSVYEALASGNHIAFMRNIADSEEHVVEQVAKYIQSNLDIDRDGSPDLTEEKVNSLLAKVLDLKVKMGLLMKEHINGHDVYVLDPRIYNPTTFDVLKESFFSNQWPWTSKDTDPTTSQPSNATMLFKAAKNFALSFWRVNMQTVTDNYERAEKNPQQLIVVDKSIRRLWVYDAQTRSLLDEFDVGIGKGGLRERRFVGDHSTPTGTYMVVQKRDDEWWREHKGKPLPEYYGGIEGGMLVLAGQWHPEIAIHGTDSEFIGEVSNGCVRVSNGHVRELLDDVPLGSMVVITQ